MKDRANVRHVLQALSVHLFLINQSFVHLALIQEQEMLFARYAQQDRHAIHQSFYLKFVPQDFMQEKDQLSV